jgi:hypothetical protein
MRQSEAPFHAASGPSEGLGALRVKSFLAYALARLFRPAIAAAAISHYADSFAITSSGMSKLA